MTGLPVQQSERAPEFRPADSQNYIVEERFYGNH